MMMATHSKLTDEQWEEFVRLCKAKTFPLHDLASTFAYFPDINAEVSMLAIYNTLYQKCPAVFLKHSEDYDKRKALCENDAFYKQQRRALIAERGNVCEVSGKDIKYFQRLHEKIFNVIGTNPINIFLNVHHLDGGFEYGDLEPHKDRLLVVNRAIHMTLHRLDALEEFFPDIRNDIELQYYLGTFIPDREGKHHWDEAPAAIQPRLLEPTLFAFKIITVNKKNSKALSVLRPAYYGKEIVRTYKGGSTPSHEDSRMIIPFDITDPQDVRHFRNKHNTYLTSGLNASVKIVALDELQVENFELTMAEFNEIVNQQRIA